MAKVIIVANTDYFFLSHRKAIGARAISDGYEVIVAAKATDPAKVAEIQQMGARYIDLPGNPTGRNLMQELSTFRFLSRLYRKEHPDVVHHVGVKNVLWGSLAAKAVRVPGVLNAVCGLGVMFNMPLTRTAKMILRFIRFGASRKNALMLFQNTEDRELFQEYGIVDDKDCLFAKGSGVDLEEYAYTPPLPHDKTIVAFSGRMVEDKGVKVLVEAASLLKEKYGYSLEFRLCGGLSTNPNALSAQWLADHCDGSYIRWMGNRTDMVEMLTQCDIMAFPSYYREGVPKAVIEATAIGRPIVTTDSVGCRDTVDEGINGFLVPPRDAQALADAIEKLHLNPEMRLDMGRASRRKAEKEFDIREVVDLHSSAYKSLIENSYKRKGGL